MTADPAEPRIERALTIGSPAKQATWREVMKRRMRIKIEPHPGESLPGVICRSTRVNVLEENKHLLAMAGIEIFNPALLAVGTRRELARLAEVIGCPEAALRACATPYVEEGTRTEGVTAGDGILRRTDLHLQSRRISPLSLRHSDHHRASWLVNLLPYCPESLELLRDDCSECGAELRWRNSYDAARCDSCRSIVAPTAGDPLAPGLADDYRLFASLVSTIPRERQAALACLPPEVCALDPLALVDLCLQLGSLCRQDSFYRRRLAFHHLDPAILGSVAAGGAALLRGWPDEAVNRCRALAEDLRRAGRPFYQFRDAIKRLGDGCHSRPSQKALVREAFPDLFGSFNRSFAPAEAILISTEACRATSLSGCDIRRLRDAGVIRARELPCGSGERTRHQHDRGDVLAVAEAMRDIVPAASVASRLGLPVYAVEQMCCAGLVRRADHPAVRLLRKRLHVTETSAEALTRMLTDRARSGTPPPGNVPLFLATRGLGGRMKPWAAMVDALVNERIPYWNGGGADFLMRTLVLPDAIQDFVSVTFDESEYPEFPFSMRITGEDAGDVLNVGDMEMNRAKPGLSRAMVSNEKPHWSRTKVLLLAEKAISSSEVASRTGRSVSWIRARIKAAGIGSEILGWSRAEVESLAWINDRPAETRQPATGGDQHEFG